MRILYKNRGQNTFVKRNLENFVEEIKFELVSSMFGVLYNKILQIYF